MNKLISRRSVLGLISASGAAIAARIIPEVVVAQAPQPVILPEHLLVPISATGDLCTDIANDPGTRYLQATLLIANTPNAHSDSTACRVLGTLQNDPSKVIFSRSVNLTGDEVIGGVYDTISRTVLDRAYMKLARIPDVYDETNPVLHYRFTLLRLDRRVIRDFWINATQANVERWQAMQTIPEHDFDTALVENSSLSINTGLARAVGLDLTAESSYQNGRYVQNCTTVCEWGSYVTCALWCIVITFPCGPAAPACAIISALSCSVVCSATTAWLCKELCP